MTSQTPGNEWKHVQDRWQVLRPRIAAYWTRFTDEELYALPGDRGSLVALVKKYYGLATFEAEAQVDTWLAGIVRELGTPTAAAPTEAPPADRGGLKVIPLAPEPEDEP
jgi:hypothetical protein